MYQDLLSKKDLTTDQNHALCKLVETIKDRLYGLYGVMPTIERGHQIVSVEDNYYLLGYQKDEVTLGTRYTKYIDSQTMLRTQMSSTIPSLLRNYQKIKEDTIWLCPGMVYRRDVRDKTHVGEPHQCDIWYLSQKKMNRSDLLGLVQLLIGIIEGIKGENIEWRYNETSHPYADGGIEVEILYRGQWLELLECGLISQKLLDNHNLSNYGGLALGLGLERLLMIVKDIGDIRVIRSHNPRVAKQMTDYQKYREISLQPATKRDLSIAVEKNTILEELTEKVMQDLPSDCAQKIETIETLSETLYEDLPTVAITRLGMVETQKNILLRVVLRDVGSSITSEEANMVYTQIYQLVHCGSAGYKI